MSEATASWPTGRIRLGLARLLVGYETDVFENGAPEPWRSVGLRLLAVDVNKRQELLRSEVTGIEGVDWEELSRDVAAIDPRTDSVPPEISTDGPAALPEAPAFPLGALPEALARFVHEGADALQCPPDYIAIPLLASASAAIGTTVRLQIKRDWNVWALLYTAVVAPSGAKKSPAMQFALQFVHTRDLEFQQAHQESLRNYDQAMAAYKLALDTRRRARNNSGVQDLPDKPNRPILKRVAISDATVEAIGKRLGENPRGLLMVRDEMASLLRGFNQYKGGRGNDEQFFLSVWSSIPTTIDRKQDEDPVVLPQPLLAITVGVQPSVLPKILSRDRLDHGFAARLLFTDPTPLPFHSSDATVREETVARAGKVFKSLFQISHAQPFSLPPEPHIVRLTAEARSLFREWEDAIGKRIDGLSDDDPFRAPLSKMPGYLGRLALILHIMKWTQRGTDTFDDLDRQTMSEAIELADYFTAHAARVWQRLVESPEDTQMRQLEKWMAKRRSPVTARDILRSGVGRLRSSGEVQTVLDRMCDCDLIVPRSIGKTIRYSRTSAEKGRSDCQTTT